MSYPTFRLPMGIVFYQTSSRATYKDRLQRLLCMWRIKSRGWRVQCVVCRYTCQ